MVTAKAAWLAISSTPLSAWRSSGLSTVCEGWSPGLGASVTTSSRATGVATMALAHQRQRGEGSVPVGVSSRTKPMQANAATTVAGMYRATRLAAGGAPGLATA